MALCSDTFGHNHLDTFMDGKCITYYPNGSIETIHYYKRGKVDSIYDEYDSSGRITSRYLLYHDDLVGIYQYSCEKIISYNAIDCDTESFFEMRFDSSENKVKKGSMLISRNIESTQSDRFGNNEHILNYVFFIAQPPNYNIDFRIAVYRVNNLPDTTIYDLTPGKIIVDTFRTYSLSEHVIKYKTVFRKSGHYQIICAENIINPFTKTKMWDTLSMNYTVN